MQSKAGEERHGDAISFTFPYCLLAIAKMNRAFSEPQDSEFQEPMDEVEVAGPVARCHER